MKKQVFFEQELILHIRTRQLTLLIVLYFRPDKLNPERKTNHEVCHFFYIHNNNAKLRWQARNRELMQGNYTLKKQGCNIHTHQE